MLDTVSSNTVHKLELDVRYGCGEGHSIAAVGAKGKIEYEYLLELWLCQCLSLFL